MENMYRSYYHTEWKTQYYRDKLWRQIPLPTNQEWDEYHDYFLACWRVHIVSLNDCGLNQDRSKKHFFELDKVIYAVINCLINSLSWYVLCIDLSSIQNCYLPYIVVRFRHSIYLQFPSSQHMGFSKFLNDVTLSIFNDFMLCIEVQSTSSESNQRILLQSESGTLPKLDLVPLRLSMHTGKSPVITLKVTRSYPMASSASSQCQTSWPWVLVKLLTLNLFVKSFSWMGQPSIYRSWF